MKFIFQKQISYLPYLIRFCFTILEWLQIYNFIDVIFSEYVMITFNSFTKTIFQQKFSQIMKSYVAIIYTRKDFIQNLTFAHSFLEPQTSRARSLLLVFLSLY